MPEPIDFISQDEYDSYTAAWLDLIRNGNDDALQEAFQTAEAARINYLPFSIDQIVALVTAADVSLIKARFLLMPNATGQASFSVTLFALDANGHRLSDYYIPTQAAATTTQAVDPSTGPSTQITPAVAFTWLAAWVNADALTTAEFATPHGPLHGFNFEVGTFQDPLARAQPYADKCLFLNLGLRTEAEATMSALVVYIGRIGSRSQGSLEGIPENGSFYDNGMPCPPSPKTKPTSFP